MEEIRNFYRLSTCTRWIQISIISLTVCILVLAMVVLQRLDSISGRDVLLQNDRFKTQSLWQWSDLGQSLDVMVPNGAVDVGGRVVIPHPPSGRLPGFGGGRQFLSDVLSSQGPGAYSGHQGYKNQLSPKEAQAYFLAKSVMNGIHRSRIYKPRNVRSVPVPSNAHWVGMSKDSHGNVFYADASGTLFDKKNDDLVAEPKRVRTSDGAISLEALRKAYEKAHKYLKSANKPILHMKANHKSEDTAHSTEPASTQSVPPSDANDSRAELMKAAATLGAIAKSLKVRKPRASGLASVAKELADASSRLGATILSHDGASSRALTDYVKAARSRSAQHADATGSTPSGGLDRELRIEMDLHSRLFGRHGLCTGGAFRETTICKKLAVSAQTLRSRPPSLLSPPLFRGRHLLRIGAESTQQTSRGVARCFSRKRHRTEGDWLGCPQYVRFGHHPHQLRRVSDQGLCPTAAKGSWKQECSKQP
jgi:hypothetical protein